MNESSIKIDLKFFCTNDIVSPEPIEFLKIVQTIDEKLKAVAKKQKEIAIDLQSRNVALKKIPTKYSKWQEQLSGLSSTIEECRIQIEEKSKQLPFLNNTACKECSEGLSVLDQYSYRLREKNIQLRLLIDSPEHQATLQLLKKNHPGM